jgi:arsenate reductase
MAGNARRILFVCIGNSCRSQMAEGLARHLGGERIEAASAGTAPARFVSEGALEALAEKGIDTAPLRSKGLDEVDVASFDSVISMGCCSADELCPVAYAGHREDWDVPDPMGKPIEEFRRVRDLIEGKVTELLERTAAAAEGEEGG